MCSVNLCKINSSPAPPLLHFVSVLLQLRQLRRSPEKLLSFFNWLQITARDALFFFCCEEEGWESFLMYFLLIKLNICYIQFISALFPLSF